MSTATFATVETAIEDIRHGRMVVIWDGAEGALALGAQLVTAADVNFMSMTARGLVCLAMTDARCRALGLAPMVASDEGRLADVFTVSIDARNGVSTGISAEDRARTIRVAVDHRSTRRDLVRPGHVFPLRAREGGVLERGGHPEAAVDLARIAGLAPAGVLCTVLNRGGAPAGEVELARYCTRHELALVRVRDLVEWRCRNEPLIARAAEAALPTRFGVFSVIGYGSRIDGREHVALTRGSTPGSEDVLVAVHSECLAGDAFRALSCDCREHLARALARIADEGGVLVYLGRTRRGLDLLTRPPLDGPDFAAAAQIIADVGLVSIRLLADDPAKAAGLVARGVTVSERVRLSANGQELVGHHNHSPVAM